MTFVDFCIKNAEGEPERVDWIASVQDGEIPKTLEIGLRDAQYASDVIEMAVRGLDESGNPLPQKWVSSFKAKRAYRIQLDDDDPRLIDPWVRKSVWFLYHVTEEWEPSGEQYVSHPIA